MFKQKLFRNPVVISTILTLLMAITITAIYLLFLKDADKLYLWLSLGVIAIFYVTFQFTLWLKKKNSAKAQNLETEEEALSMVIQPLLANSGKKPIYLMLGNKGSGRRQFLFNSSAIKPMDRTRTAKNDFFEWYESDSAVYIKPDQRLVFQEISSSDASLWNTFIEEVIRHRPRKPFSGCLFFIDFEFMIVSEPEQKEYTISSLLERLSTINSKTSSALPIYLIMSKLDKLDGFKEYMHFSSLKTRVEFLSIPLKEAKGVFSEYYRDSYRNLVKVLESNALDASANSTDIDEKQAILAFPKQFELCQSEVSYVLERLCDVNNGVYSLDIREIFFSSSLQGGRKYNLLAKSCSNYFNLPIIASEHTQLTETPYFSRFLIDSQILPESDFAGENKTYLRLIQRQSRLAILGSIILLAGGSYFFATTLDSNLHVMNQLLSIDDKSQAEHDARFSELLENATKAIEPSYGAWLKGSKALDEEILPLNISRLDQSTRIAYEALLKEVAQQLIPLIEKGYRLQLAQNQNAFTRALPLLKGYLMLNDPSKRDIRFLRHQTLQMMSDLSNRSDVVDQAMRYLDAYFRTQFAPIDINMDLVRATRRSLLANSNVDLVYAGILNEASSIDLGTLDLQRAVGFEFSNVFNTPIDSERLIVDKIYTSTGFSTFYRPRVDLMSQRVISDNWVLGLSQHVIPTNEEQEAFKEEVRKKYTDDYINNWRNALSELKVQNYDNVGDLTNAIDLISGPSSPMTTVLKQVYANTQFSPVGEKSALISKLDPKLAAAADSASDAVEEVVKPDYLLMQRVEQAFHLLNQLQVSETPNSPTPWDETVAALSRVRTYMKDIADAPDPQMAALAAAQHRMNSTEADPLIKLKQIAQKSPEPVRSWLLDVVQQSWSVMITESAKGIQTQWYSEIYTKFKEIGLGKYPFDLTATEEISIEDFELLFASGGLLDTFIQKNFAPFYDTNLWTPKQVDGETMPISPALLVQLRNYNVIRDTLINKSTNRVHIPFSARVLDLDSSAIRASLKIADTNMSYYHGPSRIREMAWPPQNGDFNISITLQDVTDEGRQHVLNKSGQWAIYRLLGDSTLTNTHNGSFVSDIKVSGRDLSLRITPLTQKNPFTLAELYNFTLPESIK
ncbi:type VI secretion system membrane subunit TssM [Vibrio antiquarius]|uniref:type VI secretion system membrane subunit TssM n=1 Tax=Vibrio antiquarius (strain Ex25) TaxID=150340 RepID=UPI00265998E9|nr:type VI secretion system membrane subunit TssM [Vibrio antiquarius]MCR9581584.1 type VI secretion system membrane subunit TssM [Vibrio antiquarius]MCR9620120.1 type VI secretion system membrane subunit TssM [Vibrio antiquarius]